MLVKGGLVYVCVCVVVGGGGGRALKKSNR